MKVRTRRQSSSRGPSPSLDEATAYALDVHGGRIIAGPHVRAACARHLRDLEEGPARGLKWDPELVGRVCRFFRMVLRLNGGQHEGLPFDPLPWQRFILGSLFGWLGPDGNRRFRVAFVETGKGSGKSPLAAGIGLYMMLADNEARSEVYAAATKKDQAMVLFRDAVAMVELSPALTGRVIKSGGNPVWNLAHLDSGSFFRPIASDDGQSGPRPHCALLDEIHEHRSDMMVEMMRAGTKGRRSALIFMITNSGFDRTSVCYDRHLYGTKVAAGELEDDSFFAFICATDEGEDPFTDESDAELGYPKSWAKANPSIGQTFTAKYLEEQVREAKGMPAKESTVRRLNFCEWVDAENPWIDGDLWRACEVEDSELPAGSHVLSLDLSAKHDLTACARNVRDGDGVASEVRFWTPKDTLAHREGRDRVPYSAWVRGGFLNAVPGRTIDYGYVVRDLADWLGPDCAAIAFDQWRIDDFRAALDDAGIESWIGVRRIEPDGTKTWVEEGKSVAGQGIMLVRHGQGFGGGASDASLWMPRSIGDLEGLVMSGRFKVKKNPVLTYNSASAVMAQDATGNKKWEKRKSTGRIDGIVTVCMGVGAVVAIGEPEGSVYEERGLLTI